MKKVIFFSAGMFMQPEEQTKLNQLIGTQLEVEVRNAALAVNQEQCDFVYGKVPTHLYPDVPVWTPGSEPEPVDGAVITQGQVVNNVPVKVNGTPQGNYNVTFSVVDGAITGIDAAWQS